jgi:hypothetical protein
MNPSLLKRFVKKLTRERVVPIISANIAWLILGITFSGLLSLPNCASNNREAHPALAQGPPALRGQLDQATGA